MTEQKHTPEPWRSSESTVHVGSDGSFDMAGVPFPAANARRVAACINACAGLDTEYLEATGLPEFAGKQLCADMVQQELDAVTAERDRLRAVCAEAYQFAGAYDAPVEVLDNLSAAANGWPLPHESFLPVDDSKAVAQRDQLRAVLAAIVKACDACEADDNKSLIDEFTDEIEQQARAALAATE